MKTLITLLTSIWFYAAFAGVAYTSYLGATAYFLHKGKIRCRNNDDRRERLEIATAAIVTLVLLVEKALALLLAAQRSLPSDTDEGWTPVVFVGVVFFFWIGYSVLLFGVDWLAGIIRLGLFQKQRINARRRKAQEVVDGIHYEQEKRSEFERKLMQNALYPSTH